MEDWEKAIKRRLAMTKHLFGMVLTQKAIFANNRGENEGPTNTLQKVLNKGELYTTISAESIRYAIRDIWQEKVDRKMNRTHISHKEMVFNDADFKKGLKEYIDDDILGYMKASDDTKSRRAILEITRAISIGPWRGELMNNFASPGSNPGVSHKNPIPYSVEVHHTRYQYGFAMTPQLLGIEGLKTKKDLLDSKEKKERIRFVLEAIRDLRRVGGNHSRYFSDYSPEIIVLRWTDDPVPRFLYCFEETETGEILADKLVKMVSSKDIEPEELIVGAMINFKGLDQLKAQNVTVINGIKNSIAKILEIINENDLIFEPLDESKDKK